MSLPFSFKQFTVHQNKCAMKIGTDGVLLGAWVSLQNQPFSILDVGAGSGVISLQLAQRSHAEVIEAIEIDGDAYEQCVFNFEHSPWADRLFCFHASAQEYAAEMEEEYDLIISNPPFYTDTYKSGNSKRDTARFTETLPFKDLAIFAYQFLSKNGVFALILPKKEETGFIDIASEIGLYPNRICHVKGTPNSEVKRSLIEFSFQKKEIEFESLTIETARHEYTPAYKELVQNFYLKM